LSIYQNTRPVAQKRERGELLNPLESFVYHNEPAGVRDEMEFREGLRSLIRFAREVSPPKFCKACGAEPGDDCKTASTLEVPRDCINP
jgi:hypothetical protein